MELKKQRQPEACEFMPSDYFARLDPQEIFGNNAPIEIDLGCGDGSFLIAMAEKYPERNFLGVERLLGRVRKVSRKAEQAGLSNCKVLRLESKYVIEYLFPEKSIDRLHLLCPRRWICSRNLSKKSGRTRHSFIQKQISSVSGKLKGNPCINFAIASKLSTETILILIKTEN